MSVLKQISEIKFSGNIIPLSWYTKIGTKNKAKIFKANLLAINILAEIIYWYRLREIRDETTGQLTGYKRKFKADKLQIRYQLLADKFGVTKLVCKRTIDFMIQEKLITREFRHFKTETGMQLSNVMFVEPVPETIRSITQVIPSLQKSKYGATKKLPHINKKVKTYTETTTKNTTDINIDIVNDVWSLWLKITPNQNEKLSAKKKKDIVTTVNQWGYDKLCFAMRKLVNHAWSKESNNVNLNRLISVKDGKRERNMNEFTKGFYEKKKQIKQKTGLHVTQSERNRIMKKIS